MVTAADTSFLFSLYGNDCHSATAAAWISETTDPLRISVFNDFELRNALRFAEFCKRVSPGTSASQLALFENAIREGRLVLYPSNLPEILAEASCLSQLHTLSGGHRSFDILHVAAAKVIGATCFLTFDANQKRLAEHEGMTVPL